MEMHRGDACKHLAQGLIESVSLLLILKTFYFQRGGSSFLLLMDILLGQKLGVFQRICFKGSWLTSSAIQSPLLLLWKFVLREIFVSIF